jgi:hypothetical protein
MEAPGGMLSRLVEKFIGWIILGLLIALGVAIWQMGPDRRAWIWNAAWRTGFWVAVTAALPWVSRLVIKRLLELGSNWAGCGLIAALTLVNAVVGLVLMQSWPHGGWGWLAALAALAIAGTYNYLVAEYLSEQAGG